MDSGALVFGLQLGGTWWILSGIALFVPLFLELALPYWGKRGRLPEFTTRCLLAVLCATIPGGSALGAALVLRERTRENPELTEPELAPELLGLPE